MAPVSPQGRWKRKLGFLVSGASTLPVLSLHPNPSRLILGEGDSQIPSSRFPKPHTRSAQLRVDPPPSAPSAGAAPPTASSGKCFLSSQSPTRGALWGPHQLLLLTRTVGSREVCVCHPNLTQVLGHQGPSPGLAPPTAGAAPPGPDPSPLTAQETRLLALVTELGTEPLGAQVSL